MVTGSYQEVPWVSGSAKPPFFEGLGGYFTGTMEPLFQHRQNQGGEHAVTKIM